MPLDQCEILSEEQKELPVHQNENFMSIFFFLSKM